MSKTLPTIEQIKTNTAFKTDERAEAVQETLKWLEQGAPHKFDGLPGNFRFDMGIFIDHENRGDKRKPNPECGTACCIAGAIRMFEREGKTYRKGSPMRDICDFFPTDEDAELADLFFVNSSQMFLSQVTPKGAAKTLRRYIKTGKTKWKEKEQ